MKSASHIHLTDVQSVYSGPEGRLWELLMGQQIHIGGLQSSTALADHAGIRPGQQGVDLCCASGAGMRFLVRFRNVSRMHGVDATRAMLELGRQRCLEEGLADRMTFVEADVCATGLPGGAFDFVWGEDAWCYVEHKDRLIAEAVRLTRPQGIIAFTDWMEGSKPMSDAEAARCLRFMKFPSLLTLADYAELLRAQGCRVREASDTGRFADYMPLYLDMLEKQLTYDALKIIGFDAALAEGLLTEMHFLKALADAGKIIQGLVVAQKP
jgi:ubiquinone/menaquinone biosynthesis C-methylase UbiE